MVSSHEGWKCNKNIYLQILPKIINATRPVKAFDRISRLLLFQLFLDSGRYLFVVVLKS